MLYNPRQDQTNRDILAAADIIRMGGLCKRMLWNGRGEHCINGALMVAITGEERTQMTGMESDRFWAAGRRISVHLGLSANDALSPIPTWNNHPKRTQEEVVAALCGAIGVSADVLV